MMRLVAYVYIIATNFRWFLHSLNKKYDRIAEPKRLSLLIGLALPGIILSSLSPPVLVISGWVYLFLLMACRMSYIDGWLKSDGAKRK